MGPVISGDAAGQLFVVDLNTALRRFDPLHCDTSIHFLRSTSMIDIQVEELPSFVSKHEHDDSVAIVDIKVKREHHEHSQTCDVDN